MSTFEAKKSRRIYKTYFKRPIDIFLSVVAIVLFSPILIAVAILIRIKLGYPVVFKQKRPGLNEELFTLYKFRTMSEQKDEYGNLLPDQIRLTRFGRFLRSTSLDELPELINIFKGEMSFVGPRPLLVQYLPLYSKYQKHRHNVRPGLSGLAQVNGRNTLTWEEKLKLDVEYVNDISFFGDCKIILLTIKKVLQREGINSNTSATMEPFKGSNNGVDNS